MKFSDIVKETKEWLQRDGRLAYRTLKMEFDLNDEQLDVLKEQLIDTEELANDKDGKMLVWTGDGASASASQPLTPTSQAPASYTPPTPRRTHPGRTSGHGIPWGSRW